LHTFANESAVPYLTWFSNRAVQEGNLRYSFLLMTKDRPAMVEEMAQRGFPVKWIRYDHRQRKRGMLKALPWLWWHIQRMKPDIVHCNLFDDIVPGLLAAWLAKVPVRMMSRQDTGYHWLHARKWMAADRWNARMATDIITISEEAREFLINIEGTPANKLHLVHNGIPPEVFTRQSPEAIARLKKRFSTAGRFPVIGTVARFIPWKGYEHIVQAATHIVRRQPRALFVYCGQGSQLDDIKQQVADAKREGNIVFTGWVDRADMPSLYGLLDIYLHAAIMEPFGLVYPEAMMNAVPVVSTPTGAARDAIIDGTNGILAERNGESLAHGVERLLAMDLKAVGLAGRETAMRMYSFDVMWNGTMEVYRQALSKT